MGIADRLRTLRRRIADSLRQEGSLRFALRALVSPFYRAEVLRAQPLRLGVPPPSPSASIRAAGVGDVTALQALNPRHSVRELEERLSRGTIASSCTREAILAATCGSARVKRVLTLARCCLYEGTRCSPTSSTLTPSTAGSACAVYRGPRSNSAIAPWGFERSSTAQRSGEPLGVRGRMREWPWSEPCVSARSASSGSEPTARRRITGGGG